MNISDRILQVRDFTGNKPKPRPQRKRYCKTCKHCTAGYDGWYCWLVNKTIKPRKVCNNWI